MIEKVTLEKTTYAPPPLRFEAGTPIIGSVIALKAAIEWIESVGIDTLEQHEASLHRELERGLRTIQGLRILGPPPKKGPIATFSIEGVHTLDLATLLDVSHIAIRSGHLCAQPALRKFGLEAAARASLGAYNTKEDVEKFLMALQATVKRLRFAP
jgi:cysteine desulfurase/selenocysteine lyase